MPLPVQLGYHCTVDTGRNREGRNRQKKEVKREIEIGCSIPEKCPVSKCQSNLGHYEVPSKGTGVTIIHKSVCPNQPVEQFLEENIQVCPQKCNEPEGQGPPKYYSEQTNDCQLCPRGYT